MLTFALPCLQGAECVHFGQLAIQFHPRTRKYCIRTDVNAAETLHRYHSRRCGSNRYARKKQSGDDRLPPQLDRASPDQENDDHELNGVVEIMRKDHRCDLGNAQVVNRHHKPVDSRAYNARLPLVKET
jgi:hypothetical protein